MGVRISEAVTRLPSRDAVRMTERRQPRFEEDSRGRVRPVSDQQANPLFDREPRDVLRVGFGNGTVTVPAMAQRTVRRGMQGAERLVPSVEELQEQARERAAETRERTIQQPQENDRSPTPETLDYARAEAQAATQAQDFINTLDRAAARVHARLEGRETPDAPNVVDIRVGDQQVPFARPINPPQFNVFA